MPRRKRAWIDNSGFIMQLEDSINNIFYSNISNKEILE